MGVEIYNRKQWKEHGDDEISAVIIINYDDDYNAELTSQMDEPITITNQETSYDHNTINGLSKGHPNKHVTKIFITDAATTTEVVDASTSTYYASITDAENSTTANRPDTNDKIPRKTKVKTYDVPPSTEAATTEMTVIAEPDPTGISNFEVTSTHMTPTGIKLNVSKKTTATVTNDTEKLMANAKRTFTTKLIMTDAIINEMTTNTDVPAAANTSDTGMLTEKVVVDRATSSNTAASTIDAALRTDAYVAEISTNTKVPYTDVAINTEAESVEKTTITNNIASSLNTEGINIITDTEGLNLNIQVDYNKFDNISHVKHGANEMAIDKVAASKLDKIKTEQRIPVTSIAINVKPAARNATTITPKTLTPNYVDAKTSTKKSDTRRLTNKMKKSKQHSISPPPPSTVSLVKEVNFIDSSYVIYFNNFSQTVLRNK